MANNATTNMNNTADVNYSGNATFSDTLSIDDDYGGSFGSGLNDFFNNNNSCNSSVMSGLKSPPAAWDDDLKPAAATSPLLFDSAENNPASAASPVFSFLNNNDNRNNNNNNSNNSIINVNGRNDSNNSNRGVSFSTNNNKKDSTNNSEMDGAVSWSPPMNFGAAFASPPATATSLATPTTVTSSAAAVSAATTTAGSPSNQSENNNIEIKIKNKYKVVRKKKAASNSTSVTPTTVTASIASSAADPKTTAQATKLNNKRRDSNSSLSVSPTSKSPKTSNAPTNDNPTHEQISQMNITALDKIFQGKSSFPMNLCLMLESVQSHNLAHVTSWLPCGKGFVINDTDAFLGEVLPKYFKTSRHTKIRSFYRKLNRWGFTISRAGSSKGAWEHPEFNRQKAAECLKIALETGETDVFDALSLNHSSTAASSSGSGGNGSGIDGGGGGKGGRKKRRGSLTSSLNGSNSGGTTCSSPDALRRWSNYSMDDDDSCDFMENENMNNTNFGSDFNAVGSTAIGNNSAAVAAAVTSNINIGDSNNDAENSNSNKIAVPSLLSMQQDSFAGNGLEAFGLNLNHGHSGNNTGQNNNNNHSNNNNNNNNNHNNNMTMNMSSQGSYMPVAAAPSMAASMAPPMPPPEMAPPMPGEVASAPSAMVASVPFNIQNNMMPNNWGRASFSTPQYQNPGLRNTNSFSGFMNSFGSSSNNNNMNNAIRGHQRGQPNATFYTRASWTEGTTSASSRSSLINNNRNFHRNVMPSRAFFPLNMSDMVRERLVEGESDDLLFDDEPLDFGISEEERNPNEPLSQEDQELAEFFERFSQHLDRNPNL